MDLCPLRLNDRDARRRQPFEDGRNEKQYHHTMVLFLLSIKAEVEGVR